MKILAVAVLFAVIPALGASAEEFDARSAVGITAGRSVDAALKRAEKENKRVLVFALDPKKQNQGFHIKGMLEFEETRKLVRDHFILVVTDYNDRNIRGLVTDANKERPCYILFNKDGSVVQKGTAAVGGMQGSKIVKEWIGQ